MIRIDWLQIIKLVGENYQSKFKAKQLVMKQFFFFCLIGVLNTVTDWLVYYLLTRGLGIYYLVANIFSFILAACLGYFLNSRFTFNQTKFTRVHFLKYAVVSVMTLALVQVALYWLVDNIGMWDLLAKVLVLIISVLSNFFWNKYWTFV